MGKPNSSKKLVKKHPGGAPVKFDAEVIAKLKAAFANSFTVDQAAIYAGVTKQTLYNWKEQYPELFDDVWRYRENPTMKAKQVVIDSVNKGDIETAKWWLKNKASDEFGSQTNPTVNINFNQVVKEQKEKYGI